MSKFNTNRVANPRRVQVPASPVKTTPYPTARTAEGALGYGRDYRSELFLLAVTNMVSEGTFYESADARDTRFEALVQAVAVKYPEWMVGFVGWLRNSANMRTASVVAAVEGARAMLKAGIPGGRALLRQGMARADEPGVAVAYWLGRYGRTLPKPIKRGIADAAVELYNEFSFLKWDSERNPVRFADVIELVHPDPKTMKQNQLFRYILDARHGHNAIADEKVHASYLPMIGRRVEWQRNADAGVHLAGLLDPEHLRGAGLTWEDVLSALGSKVDKAKLWEGLIPTMGYMALLRNLRNFDQAGVSDLVAQQVTNRLTDPALVRESRQFPYRFLTAYRSLGSVRWAQALETALDLSIPNVPKLSGRTLVLVDMSGSMSRAVSDKSTASRADVAALFGAVLASRNPAGTDVVQFGTNAERITFNLMDSALRTVSTKFRGMGGTYTARAMQQFYAGHDRVIVITDEQSADGDPGKYVPTSVPMYTWNLAGYRVGSSPSGSGNRHTFGGLNDAAFNIVPLLERRADAGWPWENADVDAAAR